MIGFEVQSATKITKCDGITNHDGLQSDKVQGANYSGSSFTTVYGELVTKYYNCDTKGNAKPFYIGFNTDLDVTNK